MTDFLTVTELGDYIGRDLSSDDGASLAVSMACEAVRTLTEQDFGVVSASTVQLDGTGTDTLLLPQVPVTAAGTVVENGGTLTADQHYTVTSEGHLIKTSGTADWSTWSSNHRGGTAYWPEGRQNISVTYTHGYSGTAPEDVRMVALMIASRLVIQGVNQSAQVGQANYRYAVASTDLTAGERAILRKYKVSQ